MERFNNLHLNFKKLKFCFTSEVKGVFPYNGVLFTKLQSFKRNNSIMDRLLLRNMGAPEKHRKRELLCKVSTLCQINPLQSTVLTFLCYFKQLKHRNVQSLMGALNRNDLTPIIL